MTSPTFFEGGTGSFLAFVCTSKVAQAHYFFLFAGQVETFCASTSLNGDNDSYSHSQSAQRSINKVCYTEAANSDYLIVYYVQTFCKDELCLLLGVLRPCEERILRKTLKPGEISTSAPVLLCLMRHADFWKDSNCLPYRSTLSLGGSFLSTGLNLLPCQANLVVICFYTLQFTELASKY